MEQFAYLTINYNHMDMLILIIIISLEKQKLLPLNSFIFEPTFINFTLKFRNYLMDKPPPPRCGELTEMKVHQYI